MSAPEDIRLSSLRDIRETVRQRYAAAAAHAAVADQKRALAVESTCCGGAPVATTDEHGREVFGAELYGPDATQGAPAAVAASLGCGVPTAVADLHPGEIVLGLGAGADVLISARRVAPGGRAIGLDMTVEMLELARRNAAAAGVDNVEFLQGYLEDLPLLDDSVDVVISNCVLNLAADKNVVLVEAARVLRTGGRLAFSDVIADEGMDETTKADMAQWTGCIAGGLDPHRVHRSAHRRGVHRHRDPAHPPGAHPRSGRDHPSHPLTRRRPRNLIIVGPGPNRHTAEMFAPR